MGEFLGPSESFILNLYREATECFRQLETEMQQEHNENSGKVQCLRAALANIQQLINIEMENTHLPFAFNATALLFPIQDRLVLLEKLHSGTMLPISSSKLTLNDTQKDFAINKKSLMDQEKNSYKDIIYSLQIKPRVKGLQDIAGLVNAKKVLATIVILPIYQPQLYEGHKICNSILLYGPPGTGKTLLVHALAAETSAFLFSVTSSNILSHYVGQTEKMIQALFETVRNPRKEPTILFIDEIDGLCRSRSSSESEWGRRLKTELMCQLSNFEDVQNTFLICATNCPWDLDSAFLRRFQQRIYIPLPDCTDRHALLELFIKDSSIQISSMSWGVLLNRTVGYSGSDLADAVRNAVNIPITELLDSKTWKSIGNNQYEPVTDNENVPGATININCDILNLPSRSVKVRDAHVGDLMAALEVVRPTVSANDITKYERFIKNA